MFRFGKVKGIVYQGLCTIQKVLFDGCKWGPPSRSNRPMVRELIEQKGLQVVLESSDGESWTFRYAVFALAGFTEAIALSARQGRLVDLARLDKVSAT